MGDTFSIGPRSAYVKVGITLGGCKAEALAGTVAGEIPQYVPRDVGELEQILPHVVRDHRVRVGSVLGHLPQGYPQACPIVRGATRQDGEVLDEIVGVHTISIGPQDTDVNWTITLG